MNILIVHYNTPKLTECLVKSINKYVGTDCNIYIFDNSDKLPFTYKQNNIVIFDNTKKQIIDFDEWGKQYPNRTSSFHSAKHAISIEKSMDLINKPFILMDSDILLKQDISILYNTEYDYIGMELGKRVLPFLCFINVPKLREKGFKYFDDNYTYDLFKNGKGKTRWDTGCMLYLNKNRYSHKNININQYMVHYTAGSYNEKDFNVLHKGQISKDSWLMINKKYWENGEYKMNKKVVYTCITGGYDNLMEPKFVTPGFDYVCFTDDVENTYSNVWKIRPIPEELHNLSNVKKQRMVKINPHKYLSEYDESIWVDGSMMVIGDMNKFINEYCTDKSVSVLFREHPARKCIYDEADTCLRMRKDTPESIKSQMDRYRKEGFPRKYGLVESNMIYRRHNDPYCIKLMETWADEVRNGSHRDQLSFNYALWKVGAEGYKCTKINVRGGLYFKWLIRHNPKRPSLKRIIKPEYEEKTEAIVPVPSPMRVTRGVEHFNVRRISKSTVYQSRSKLGMYF